MELLGDVGLVESCFRLFGDRVSVDGREVHGLRHTYIGSDLVFNVSMVLLGEEAQLEAPFSPFGASANLDAR